MKKAGTVQEIARVFHDLLMGTAREQLRTVARHIADTSSDDPEMQQRVEAALPADVLPQVRNLLLTLIQEGKIGELDGVIQALERYSQSISTSMSSEVISAVPLDEQQQEHISTELQKHYEQQLDVQFRVDETLIGGLVIRVGDQVFDNSLRSRLSSIQHNMLAS